MRYLSVPFVLLVVLGCGDPNTEVDAGAAPPEPHLLQDHEDALQRAKDAAKALEEAGARTETAIEESTSD